MTSNDDIVAALRAERDQHEQRIKAIDIAIGVLDGTGDLPDLQRDGGREIQVGPDKVEKVRGYLRQHSTSSDPWVRQADITRALGLNSGTISQALRKLERAGEAEQGPKRDRASTWRPLAA